MPTGTAPARRIVSLDVCSDWLLAYYALPGHTLWLSPRAQRFPPPSAAGRHPSHDGSLEMILALKPDWVVVNDFNAALLRQRLAAAGLRVVITAHPESLNALRTVERSIFEVLGREINEGDAPRPFLPPLTAESRKPGNASGVLPRAAPAASRGRLLLLGPNGYGVGEGTFEDDLIRHAGWSNYLERAGHIRLDLETLASHPPDRIVWSGSAHAALAQRFAQHPVLRRAVPPVHWIHTDAWRWQCPGPWAQSLVDQLRR
ncbi:MAG: ABC transporter substrate-binding protein [Betaproteobacteria bacterium]